jgi:hypothetical protein
MSSIEGGSELVETPEAQRQGGDCRRAPSKLIMLQSVFHVNLQALVIAANSFESIRLG